ncbi:hypothetical protein GCM10007853_22430 [Algimonas ampicilliniresistens]|uniref:Flagellar export protein FliJ n=1 Tax=Algimonas ampicilliniresistens TaxID=1298735 RepID=A0ABQ5VBJ5_9PROT|nr:hypothetical protein [Algimonas ampicilliniresistens]GLQ24369.1 hypothetical protein GCM10007853_22430 [Algimonas ampicilliniresistens]
MSVRKILALKRAAIQSRIDAVGMRETKLTHRIDALHAQGDGLEADSEIGRFQVAAIAGTTTRSISLHLERERDGLREQRQLLARERLSLDIADTRLETAETAEARLTASRAEDKV